MAEPIISSLYTVEDLMEQLKVTRRTLYTYIKEGKLKAQKIGGRWRVTEENLQKFINGDS